MRRCVQAHMHCGCHVHNCTLSTHDLATIGGKSFHAGEKLSLGRSCGSVVTMVSGGRSIYGLVQKFVRVVCTCDRFIDFAIVGWLPFPYYPDSDPLTVVIQLNGLDVNNIAVHQLVPLYDIQPSRVAVEIDTRNDCLYMLRIEGLDVMP